jgi:hypothetical protein
MVNSILTPTPEAPAVERVAEPDDPRPTARYPKHATNIRVKA